MAPTAMACLGLRNMVLYKDMVGSWYTSGSGLGRTQVSDEPTACPRQMYSSMAKGGWPVACKLEESAVVLSPTLARSHAESG